MVAQSGNTPKAPSPYVSISEAASYLSISEMTIRRWISTGHLPARRVGGKLIRIAVSDLEALTSPIRTA